MGVRLCFLQQVLLINLIATESACISARGIGCLIGPGSEAVSLLLNFDALSVVKASDLGEILDLLSLNK